MTTSNHSSRKHLCLYLEIIDRHSHELIGNLLDISNEGMMFITDKPIPPKQLKDVRIKLPDFEEFPKKSIDVILETRWTKPDVNPNLHRVGCHFLKITPADLKLIKRAVEELG
jgi:c-di-GMP-binding flagellar brake protein YcgR